MGNSNFTICPHCSFEVAYDEYNDEAGECQECHEGYEEPKECGCNQCCNRVTYDLEEL